MARSQEAGDAYFYSGGRAHLLKASTVWSAVELEADAAPAAVEARARQAGLLIAGGRSLHYKRHGLMVLPAPAGPDTARRARLAAKLGGLRGVGSVHRVFGNAKWPIVETAEFMIRFKPGVSRSQVSAILKARGAQLVGPLGPHAPNGFLARLAQFNQQTTAAVANALYHDPRVLWSLPNFIWPKQKRFIPNDALYPDQWHLNNTGVAGGTAGADVKAQTAWDISRGSSSITVAVIDDGVDLDHEEFTGTKFVAGFDFADNDSNPRPADSVDNHGTACAGVAAANGNNTLGVSGIAPNCKLMPIRLLGINATLQDEADSFTFAADHGADVISCSWGPTDGQNVAQPIPDSTAAGIDYATSTGRGGKGCVVFFASGNGNESVDLDGYASYPKVIAVAASTNSDRRASYSDFGQAIAFAAPSSGGSLSITTTDRMGASGYNSTNYTAGFGGTSSACPLAAGIGALVLSVNPNMTYTQVRNRMQSTADKIDPSGSGTDITGSTISYAYDGSGHSVAYGYGRLNAFRALQGLGTLYSVTGRVTLNGSGLSGVTVEASTSASTGTTSTSGDYTIAGVTAGTVTITPRKTGYVFTPASRTITLSANATGIDFTAAIAPAITLTAPLDNATVAGNYTMHAQTQGSIQSVDFSRRTVAGFTRNPNVAIPDYNSSTNTPGKVTDSQTISETGTVATASLSINIQHSFLGDLTVTLVAPDNSRLLVYDRITSSQASPQVLNQTFDDLPLSGKSIAGAWKLVVMDNAALDTGTLVSWSLSLSTGWTAIASASTVPANGDWTAVWDTVATPVGSYQVQAVAVAAAGNVSDITSNVQVQRQLFSISGHITSGGSGLAGVNVTRTGSATPVTTDSAGAYTLTGLAAGSYTITPTLGGYTFTPAARGVTIGSSNLTGIDFTATPVTKAIRGRVTNSAGTGLPNILVSRSGGAANATTDANGNYVFNSVPAGTYTIAPIITPAMNGVTFTPASRSVTINTSDLSNINFTARYSITGKVVNSANTPLPNMSVRRTGVSSTTVSTDASGIFRFTDTPSGSYTIALLATPSTSGMTFSPASYSVTVNTNSLTNINFAVFYSVSGRVVNSAGAAMANIVVARKTSTSSVTTLTDANGNYRFSDVRSGSYTIQPQIPPSQIGMSYNPASYNVTVGTNNLTNINFIAFFSITGRVTNSSGQPVANALVQCSTSSSTLNAVTDSNGNYRFSDVRAGSYTVAPHITGRTTNPLTRSVTVSTANVANINFIAS